MRERDRLRRLSEFGADLHAATTVDDVMRLGIDALRDVIDCDWPVVSLATSLLPNVRFASSTIDADWGRFTDESLHHAHEDPVYTARLRLLLDAPASATRMMPERALERTELHASVWKPMGVRRMLRYLTPGQFGYRLELARENAREFSAIDAEAVAFIARQLDAATERLALAGHDQVVVKGNTRPVQRFCWLVADTMGRVLRTTPRSAALMRRCLGPEAPLDRLPREWFEEMTRRASGRPATPKWYRIEEDGAVRSVSVHIAPIRPTPDEFSVGFLEHPRQADPVASIMARGLTRREAEVLHLLAEGMSNADIGIELGISGLTAKKHLENVFHKLGVSNRTAAVVAAIEAMRSPPAA